MKRTLVFLLSVISIWAQIWEARGYAPVKCEGHDLSYLEEFLFTDDKVAIGEIQVEDLRYVPLTVSAVNLDSGDPKASVVAITRSLRGSGAHRELETDIALEFGLEVTSGLAGVCDLVIYEKLSNGVFADPFQLQRLKEQGAFKKVHIYGDTDLERPARISYPSVVEVHTALVRKETSMVGAHPGKFQAKVSLPLHARYPPTGEENYFQLNITMPQGAIKFTALTTTTQHWTNQPLNQRFYELKIKTGLERSWTILRIRDPESRKCGSSDSDLLTQYVLHPSMALPSCATRGDKPSI
ncbi:hypothetical protein R1flu_022488 [Riccia fluitans]|uniref:Uncharacterized protein n=1 Tax=Riccia fluitans TaxID=41844 RepID=A0ABD1XSC2_9MARC